MSRARITTIHSRAPCCPHPVLMLASMYVTAKTKARPTPLLAPKCSVPAAIASNNLLLLVQNSGSVQRATKIAQQAGHTAIVQSVLDDRLPQTRVAVHGAHQVCDQTRRICIEFPNPIATQSG